MPMLKFPARLQITIWSEASKRPPRNQRTIPPETRSNLPLSEVTFANVLSREYFVAHIGKWHLGDASHYPETQGFDVNVGGTHWGCPVSYFYPYKGKFGEDDEFRYVPDLESGDEDEEQFLITSVDLELHNDLFEAVNSEDVEDDLFSCSFTAIPAELPYRPPRRTPPPVIAGPQTALTEIEVLSSSLGRKSANAGQLVDPIEAPVV